MATPADPPPFSSVSAPMRQLLTQSERRPEDALVRHELTHCLLIWRKCIIKRIIAMTVILPHTVLPNASAATLLPSERHPVAARPVLPAPLLPELSKLLARLPVQDDAEALRKSLFHAGTHFNPDLLTSEAERRARLEGVHAALDRAESLVFLDTESTGGRNGRLIEVALVETDVEQNVTGGLHFRCNPHRRSQAGARCVHGIQDCELEHCPEFAARADELLEAVRGKTVVIHDRTMDLLWLNRELQATRPGAPRFEDCCTVFTPRHPNTRPRIEDVAAAESALDVDALMEKALSGIQRVRIKNDGTLVRLTDERPPRI